MSATRYGTVDIALELLTAPIFGDQAEAVRIAELLDGGRTLRVVIKAPEDRMPDGAVLSTADLPHFRLELTERQLEVKFLSSQ